MKIWSNFFVDIEVPDDYKEKKYKNLIEIKKQRNSGIIRYEDVLFFKEVFPMIQLIESLCFDGRFYGADMTMDGYDTLDEMRGMFNYLSDPDEDSV